MKNFVGVLAAAASVALVLSSTCSMPCLAEDQLARDMYYQQLNEPTRHSNTGFRYWIELVRSGHTSRVNSRKHFRSGDQIKFHIASNIDGFAHIVLVGGSTGAKSVLFPVPGKDVSNAVRRGHECTVPANGYLVFDNNKGCEHLQIALSRRNLTQAELLKSGTRAIITPNSSEPSGTDFKVSFDDDSAKPEANAQPSDDAVIANAIPDESNARDMFRSETKPAAIHATHTAAHRPAVHHSAPATPYTTVVNTNASQDLYADISLEHD